MRNINGRKTSLSIIFILILLIVALLVGKFTFSFMGPDLGEDLTIEGDVTAQGDTLIFSKGKDISLSATTDNFNYESGNLSDTTNPSVKLVSRTSDGANAKYYAGIVISNNTFTYSTAEKTPEILLTVKDNQGNTITTSSDTLEYRTVNGISGFDITNKMGAFNIVADHPISATTNTTHTWEFTVTFINLGTPQSPIDQSINENATIELEAQLYKERIESLATHVKSLYTTQGANNLYHHDGSIKAEDGITVLDANDNSYRYVGKTPNNYVCFGYDDPNKTYAENWCPADNLYRIIGVFNEINVDTNAKEERVKLIKNTKLGSSNLAWDSNNVNKWSTATLNTSTLNGTYLTGLGDYANKIATTRWHVGGISNSQRSNQASVVYGYEVGTLVNNTTHDAQIGLMYVSDYGFAASPANWTTALNAYNNDTNKNNNWMCLGAMEWTISRRSDSSSGAFYVDTTGFVSFSYVTNTNVVRPSFSLLSSTTYAGGTGTASDPIRVN